MESWTAPAVVCATGSALDWQAENCRVPKRATKDANFHGTQLAMSSPEYDPRYLQGIQYFNECDFFEAHEVWEDLWTEYQGPARRYYQGLIQAAVCLHHFGNENVWGARKLYHSCRKYLEEYLPAYLGLDLSEFLEQLERCCHELLHADLDQTKVTICPDLIPEIHLTPAAEA